MFVSLIEINSSIYIDIYAEFKVINIVLRSMIMGKEHREIPLGNIRFILFDQIRNRSKTKPNKTAADKNRIEIKNKLEQFKKNRKKKQQENESPKPLRKVRKERPKMQCSIGMLNANQSTFEHHQSLFKPQKSKSKEYLIEQQQAVTNRSIFTNASHVKRNTHQKLPETMQKLPEIRTKTHSKQRNTQIPQKSRFIRDKYMKKSLKNSPKGIVSFKKHGKPQQYGRQRQNRKQKPARSLSKLQPNYRSLYSPLYTLLCSEKDLKKAQETSQRLQLHMVPLQTLTESGTNSKQQQEQQQEIFHQMIPSISKVNISSFKHIRARKHSQAIPHLDIDPPKKISVEGMLKQQQQMKQQRRSITAVNMGKEWRSEKAVQEGGRLKQPIKLTCAI